MLPNLQSLCAPPVETCPSGHKAELIGYLEVSEPMHMRQGYDESVAWFQDFELRPGFYPVYRGKYYVSVLIYCHVPAGIVAACLPKSSQETSSSDSSASKSGVGLEEDYMLAVNPADWWCKDKTIAQMFHDRYDHVTFYPLEFAL